MAHNTHHPLHIPAHAIHDSDLDTIKANAETWEVKDEFPYTHHRPKQYLLDVTLTFTKLHQRYKAKIEASNDGVWCIIFEMDLVRAPLLSWPSLSSLS
jgi:hypothetical protein